MTLLTRWWRDANQSLPVSLEEWLAEARSHSGFDREEAVRQLALLRDGTALPMLLERANDWVPQVRVAACAAIDVFLRDDYIDSWAKALADVAALRRAGRVNHTRLLDSIESFLCRPTALAAVKESGQVKSNEELRFLLVLQLRTWTDEAERFHILRDAITSTDIVLATLALDSVHQMPQEARRVNLASAACVSCFAQVRLRGLRLVLHERHAAARTLARAMTFDSNASVRSAAIAALDGDCDAIVLRAHELFASDGSGASRAVALDVLCTARAENAPRLCDEALTDDAAAVRRLAYARRLSGSLGSERDRLVARALADTSGRVQAIAVAFVQRGACAPPLEALLEYRNLRPESLKNLVKAAAYLSPWARLRFLFAAMDFTQPEGVSERLETELTQWTKDATRVFITPGPADAEAIATAWVSRRERVPDKIRPRLAQTLVAFKVIADSET